MKKMTREWLRKAEADFLLAEQLALGKRSFHDQLCFLCQQCAEKYLKALLEEQGQPVPRTHMLRDLQNLLLPFVPSLRSYSRGLTFLTRFAVGTRYPGDDATKRQATAAFRWAMRVRTECRSILGVVTRPLKGPKPL